MLSIATKWYFWGIKFDQQTLIFFSVCFDRQASKKMLIYANLANFIIASFHLHPFDLEKKVDIDDPGVGWECLTTVKETCELNNRRFCSIIIDADRTERLKFTFEFPSFTYIR